MRRLAYTLFALAALAAPMAGQAPADFSGKWVFDPKSAEGGMAPTSMTLDVVQDAKTIKIESAATSQMGDQKSTTVLNLDGSPSKNSMASPGGDLTMTSKGKWDGSTFVVERSGEAQGQTFTMTERWSLDSGGKVLRLQRDIAAGGQTFTVKLGFNKQ